MAILTGPARAAGYSRLQIILHWVVVILLAIQWLSGDAMTRAMELLAAHEAPALPGFLLINLHMFSGLCIWLLVCWRLYRRWLQPVAAPAGVPVWLWRVAEVSHTAFYLLLLVLPLTGLLAYYEWLSLAAFWHQLAGKLMLALFLLHMAALLLHLARRDGSWRRMIRPL